MYKDYLLNEHQLCKGKTEEKREIGHEGKDSTDSCLYPPPKSLLQLPAVSTEEKLQVAKKPVG